MIKISNLTKVYKTGKNVKVKALDSLDLNIKENEAVAIVGHSGSGKSTLLNILGGLDNDYEGHLLVDNIDIKKYNSNDYRRRFVGTIFQQFYLIPTLSVAENIMLPIRLGGQLSGKEAQERLEYLLKRLSLKNRANHKPNELSGGQAQRVAIARALIAKPKILLADEPTGNLDSKTAKEIIDLLFELKDEENTTLIIVTHSIDQFTKVNRAIHLQDGKIIKEEKHV